MDKIKNLLHLGGEKAEEKANQHGTSLEDDETSGSSRRVEASGGTYEPEAKYDPLSSSSSSTAHHTTSSTTDATRSHGMVSDIPGTSNTAYATSATAGTGYGSTTAAGTGYGSSTAAKVESMVPGTSAHREREYEQGTTGLTSGSTYGSSTTGVTSGSTGLGSGSVGSGITGSSLPDRSVGTTGTTGDIYHRNETLAHHGPHTTLTARILDPASGDAPTGIYTAADPYITTGGSVTGASVGAGSYQTSSHVTSDPYSSTSSRDPTSASNLTTTSGTSGFASTDPVSASGSHHHHHHQHDQSGQSSSGGLMDKLTGRDHDQQNKYDGAGQQGRSAKEEYYGSSGTSGNDSSRDTGLSGFSTGDPNKGGSSFNPAQELGSGSGHHSSSGQQGQSTLGRVENRAEREIDSRVDSSRTGAAGDSATSHSIVGGY